VSDSTGPAKHEPRPKSWARREWRLLAGLTLSAICLFLAARGVSAEALGSVLSIARWEWTLLAAVVVVATTFLKAVRWKALFLPQRMRLSRVWSVFMVGQMLNVLLPARAGELGRIYLIGKDEKTNSATALSTVVAEKVVDLVMLSLAYLLVAVWLAITPIGLPDWLRDAGTVLIPLTAFASLALLLFARFGRPIWRFLGRGLRPLPARWQAGVNTLAEKTIDGLEAFRVGPARTQVWGWSLLIWMLMALINGLLFPAFGLALSPFVAILLLVVLMSGVAVPPLPGNLGVSAYLCQLVLSLFGTDQETALVYGVTVQIVVYLPLVVLGSLCLLWENWSLRRTTPTSRPVP
jgi:uncharacterized protein (TIRG00374 family)